MMEKIFQANSKQEDKEVGVVLDKIYFKAEMIIRDKERTV